MILSQKFQVFISPKIYKYRFRSYTRCKTTQNMRDISIIYMVYSAVCDKRATKNPP